MRIIRKFKVAIYTAFIFTLVFFILSIFDNPHHFGLGTLFISITAFVYSLIGSLIYGIPVSLLSDYLSEKFSNSRLFLSSITHIVFGLVPLAFNRLDIGIPILLCSMIFLILDEIFRRGK